MEASTKEECCYRGNLVFKGIEGIEVIEGIEGIGSIEGNE